MVSARGKHPYHLEDSQGGSGFDWQRDRSWCETGVVERKKRKGKVVEVIDPDARAKKVDRARLLHTQREKARIRG
jgi:hypothetical protein